MTKLDARLVKLDPVTLAVLRSGLMSAVAEMKGVVVRTAYSNLWKEAGDLSCGVLTAKGDLAVQGLDDIPVHLAAMPMTLEGCLRRIPPETLRPGDVLFQNDPYQGNNHLPDFMMAKPVFFDGRIVAYAAVRGHYVDVGGGGPGSYSTAMPDIYAEGLRISPVKIYKEGELNQDIVDVLTHNTRNAPERLGDMRSQYAGCLAAERRIVAFCERYGALFVEQAMEEIIDASERITRMAIRAIPDGVYRFEDYCDNDGMSDEPIRIATAVTICDDAVEVDFTGSSPQVRGGMNAPLSVVLAATCYAIKCLTDSETPANSGSYRAIKLVAPPRSVVNPSPPAPVIAGNHETASRIADAIIGALAQAVPDRVCAAGSGTAGTLSLGARISEGGREREVLLVESHGAGQGGNSDGDGFNARRVNVGNTGNTPTEAIELGFPVHVLAYGISQDGGGAGCTRGGTGIFRELRFDHNVTVTLTSERAKFAPYGLFGGHSAPKATFWAKFPDGTRQILNSKTRPLEFPKGTILHIQAAGGGGFGDPYERDLKLVQADIDDGYVTPDAARALYGVSLRHDASRNEGAWVVVGVREDIRRPGSTGSGRRGPTGST